MRESDGWDSHDDTAAIATTTNVAVTLTSFPSLPRRCRALWSPANAARPQCQIQASAVEVQARKANTLCGTSMYDNGGGNSGKERFRPSYAMKIIRREGAGRAWRMLGEAKATG